MKRCTTPTIVSIFGVTGDLAQKKIFPALMDLYTKGVLPPKFAILGIARRDLTKEEFRTFIRKAIEAKKTYPEATVTEFLERCSYSQGQFDDNTTYTQSKQLLEKIDTEWGQCSNKLFYLSVPPTLYELIATHIASSGLARPCDNDEGWTRILIEKPFGKDIDTAQQLDALLGKLFEEEQVYRIDHYLEKQTIQNVMTFRFSNTIFEPLWNKDHIEKVEIELYEDSTVENRGAFYDDVGALRDVGQNHLLQMLALVAMEPPASSTVSVVHEKRAEVFKNLRTPQEGEVIRAQYEGYKDVQGVRSDSDTETFFSLKTYIDNKRWKGVPFFLRSGKGLKESRVAITIHFKDETPGSFLPQQFPSQEANKITISIQPEEKISILFWVKVPGLEESIEPKELSFSFHEQTQEHVDAYEKVLFDCIAGDQTSFVTTEEVLATWKYIAQVKEVMGATVVETYTVGATPRDITKLE